MEGTAGEEVLTEAPRHRIKKEEEALAETLRRGVVVRKFILFTSRFS